MSYDTDDSTISERVWPPIVPAVDVLAGLGLVVLGVGASLALGGPVRSLLGGLLALVLPGYGIVSALFPTRGTAESPAPALGTRGALAFGTSLVVLMALGLVVSLAGLPFSAPVVAVATGTVAGAGLLIAGRRRLGVPDEDRFRLPTDRWLSDLRGAVLADSGLEAAVNVALIVAVIAALSTLTYALAVPPQAGSFSSFSVLGGNGTGEPVAAEYPSELTEGQSQELTLAVENHEGETETYSVVTELQRYDRSTGTVTERSEIDRRSVTVGDGSTWRPDVTVTPQMTGDRLRLAFYLYTSDAPAEPTAESATEHLYLWVNVTESAGGSTPTETG